eukprot:5312419-Pleurochrysis_carterae.AAC.1
MSSAQRGQDLIGRNVNESRFIVSNISSYGSVMATTRLICKYLGSSRRVISFVDYPEPMITAFSSLEQKKVHSTAPAVRERAFF